MIPKHRRHSIGRCKRREKVSSNFPAAALLGLLEPRYLLLAASRACWKVALRSYTSASS
jgi:hypothetical protein